MNSLFGPKTISIKPVLAILPKIFAHSDSNVRAEGTLLAVALHCYLGPALTQSLSELKPLQVKELGDKFTEADGKGEGFGGVKQSRFTKSQQKAREVKQAAGPVEGVVEEGASHHALSDTTIWADQLESQRKRSRKSSLLIHSSLSSQQLFLMSFPPISILISPRLNGKIVKISLSILYSPYSKHRPESKTVILMN